MIQELSDFASSIVASVIALTITEMILPNNNLKKYITFVATVIIAIVIINPIATILNKNININDFLVQAETEISNKENYLKMEYAKQKSIEEMYSQSLKKDIINRLEENGYKVKNISFVIDNKSYQPIKMQVEIEHSDGDVRDVIIDVSNIQSDDISLFEIAKIKDILHSTYNIEKNEISINKH